MNPYKFSLSKITVMIDEMHLDSQKIVNIKVKIKKSKNL